METEKSKIGRVRWTILAMLLCATTINYMDRVALAQLKPIFEVELKWTEADYAKIVFSFQLAYAIGLAVVGRFMDWAGTRKGLAIIIGLIGCASASHALLFFVPADAMITIGSITVTSTVAFMCLTRFALGLAEAGTWPGCIKVVSEWLPRKERSLGSGVVNAGSGISSTIMPYVVRWLLAVVSWPFVFLFTAFLDFLLLMIWLFKYQTPAQHKTLSKEERDYIEGDLDVPTGKISWFQLLGHRQTWAFVIAKGLSDPVWWFYLFWVPTFLATQYKLTGTTPGETAAALALPTMVVYLIADIGSIFGGWMSMYLIGKGWSINAARKTVLLGCALCVVPVPLVTQGIGLWPSVLLLGLAAGGHLGFSANVFTVATDTVPKKAVASLAGLGGMVASIGGMFMAAIVGWVLTVTDKNYFILFLLAPIAYVFALSALQILLPRMEVMKLRDEHA